MRPRARSDEYASAGLRLAAACCLCLTLKAFCADASQDLIHKLTMRFADVLEECKKEQNFPEHIVQDFFNFWKEDYALVNEGLGCAIICMASKFDLMSDEMTMHHDNAQEFAKKHGADEELAKQLVEMVHGCEKEHEGVAGGDCARVLEVAKCFRTKIHELKWAPSMDLIIDEILADFRRN